MSEGVRERNTAMHRTELNQPRRWQLRFSIRATLVAVACIAVYMAVFAAERRDAVARRDALRRMEDGFYTTGPGPYGWPWYTGWLHRALGDGDPETLGFVLFDNFSYVDDQTLEDLSIFHELYDLGLGGGEIAITDAGLDHLVELQNLEDLDLVDAPVTAKAVAALRLALPNCKIYWNGEEQ